MAFASASETALTGLRRMQARRSLAADDEDARELDVTVGHYGAALVVVRLLAVIGTVSMATLLAVGALGLEWWSLLGAVLSSVILILLAEEPVRPLIARRPEAFLDRAAVLLSFLSGFLSPLTRLLPMGPDAPYIRAEKAEPEAATEEEDEEEEPVDAEEFKQLVTDLDETPEINEQERELIEGVLDLKDTIAKEIMVPRPDIAALSADATLDQLLELMARTGHSRIPLFEQSLDNVVGVVHAQDVLKHLRTQEPRQIGPALPAKAIPGPGMDLRGLARKPLFVPETKNVQELLHELRTSGVHLAVVVDEYGGVEGIVTIADILEEIVGEVTAESGARTPAVRIVNDHEVIVDGTASLEEVGDALELELEGERIDTIGGYVLHHLGHIPKAGETLKTGGIAAEVLATTGRRIKRLRVTRLPEDVKGEAAR